MSRSSSKPDRKPASPEQDVDLNAGRVPVPIWLFVLLGLLIVWGAHHLASQGGGFHASVYRPHRSIDQLQAMIPSSREEILFATGRRLYGLYCSVCHQPNGQGVPGQFPPLAQSEWVITPGHERLVRMILHGLDGPITVRGRDYNNLMPPFQDLLRDDQIAVILTFIRQNPAWGNHASTVSTHHVQEIREQTAGRVVPWTVPELLQIRDTTGDDP